MKLKPYIVGAKDEDWICVVVANSPGQARSMFYKDNPMLSSGDMDYIDIRARLAKNVIIPEEIKEPQLFEDCATWNCSVWTYDAEFNHCKFCPLGEQKKADYEASSEEVYINI